MNEIKNVELIEAHDYCDGPLTGWCEYQGKRYYFYWEDVENNYWKYVAVEVPEDFQSIPDDHNASVEDFFGNYKKIGYFLW
jgi:hypothetical protein